jgi:hypothetical protein
MSKKAREAREIVKVSGPLCLRLREAIVDKNAIYEEDGKGRIEKPTAPFLGLHR